MRERGIIMAADSVRAILAGRKTQTRRVVTFKRKGAISTEVTEYGPFMGEPDNTALWSAHHKFPQVEIAEQDLRCPYGAPGDRLWVRETYAIVPRTAYRCSEGVQQTLCPDDDHDAAIYRAGWERSTGGFRWRTPILMPRWASRLTLEVTEVRVQRVQEISEEDARAEGCHWSAGAREFGQDREVPFTARDDFASAWDAINAKRGFPWAANPWVWAVTFKRVEAA